MATTKYTYSISVDFPNHKMNSDRLTLEIRNSAIVIALDYIGTSGDDCDVWFKNSLSNDDETILDGLIAAHSGESLPSQQFTTSGNPYVSLESHQADGVSRVVLSSRLGSECVFATHNYADACSWFSESERIINQSLTDSGDGLTWTSPDENLVDMIHGRIFDEDAYVQDQKDQHPEAPHGYALIVEVSDDNGQTWDLVTEREPYATQGGDYDADYEAGTVTFYSSQSGKLVRASYSKSVSSGWLLIPSLGKAVIIEHAEVQFSVDAVLNSDLVIQVFGLVDYFAPQLLKANGGPLDPGTPIPLDSTTYRTLGQLVDEAYGNIPIMPALGGTRGLQQDMQIMQFRYGAARALYSSLGMFMRISTKDSISLGGWRVTSTFYCLSQIDPGVTNALAELTG